MLMHDAHKRFAAVVAAAFVLAATSGLLAASVPRQDSQDQQNPPSLGEVARRLRAQKRAAPSSAKVWTNDNIPKDPFGISVVGPLPAPAEEKTATEAPKNAPKTASKKTLGDLNAELAQAQQDLELKEKELDLAKRDFALLQQGFYTNPMASQNVQGQSQLTDAQKGIDTKQQEIDTLKAHIVDLQQMIEDLKKASPPPVAPPGTPPQVN
jgi:uncharacterized coiled-coil protein SlyX